MKHDLPPLDSLKVFEAAARHLSFSRAADQLCLTKGAVSYQVRKLEEQLGCALFRRATRQVYLTEAGQQLLQTTEAVFAQLRERFGQLDSQHASQVSIAVTTYVAVRWLSANIAGFNKRYPGVSIRLLHSVNDIDFELSEVDLALRWIRSDDTRNCVSLASMPMFPVCSPALLHRLGYREDISLPRQAMSQAPWCDVTLLCEDRSEDYWQDWFASEPLANPRLTLSDANVRVQAAIDGQGWMLADALMLNELHSGLLVSPFQHGLNGYGYGLLQASNRPLNQAANDLKLWLAERLSSSAQPPLLES